MSQDICVSEHLLGRRIVNYLRNEATVGRINTKKLKVEDVVCSSLFVAKRTHEENSYIIYITGLITKNKKTVKKCILLSKRQLLR